MNVRINILGIMLLGVFLVNSPLFAQKAKIKSVEYKERQRSEDAEPEADLMTLKKELKEFDAGGRMVNYVLHTANPIGDLVKNSEIKKTYQERELKMEERSKYDEGGDLLLTEKIYFETGIISKVEFTDFVKNPNMQFTKQYEYDQNTGKILSVTLFDNKGKKAGEEVWKYNKDNEEIKYTKWETLPDGKKYQESKSTEYNAKDGTLLSSEKIVKDGKDEYKEVTTFERNKMKEQVKYKNGQEISKFGGGNAKFDPSKAKVLRDFGNDNKVGFGMWANEDEFDAKGNKIKTTQTMDGVVTQITTYTYDERANLTKTKKVNYEGEQETGTEEELQEFDKNNNMLRKAVYNNGVLISEKKYDYQYY